MPLPSRSIIFAVIAVAAMTVYVAAMSMHKQSAKAHAMTSTQPNTISNLQQPLYGSAATCGAGAASHTPVNALNHIQVLARGLTEQERFAEAFAQYHSIAAINPAFPGINLDISVALLQLKDTAGAKDAIDSQIAMSDCLMKLPAESLQKYCKAEDLDSKSDGCIHRLQTIRHTAYYQAALVQMELRHSVTAAEPSVATAKPVLVTPSHAETLSTAPSRPKVANVTGTIAAVANPAKSKLVSSAKGDSLVSGAGTDSNLGAYSR